MSLRYPCLLLLGAVLLVGAGAHAEIVDEVRAVAPMLGINVPIILETAILAWVSSTPDQKCLIPRAPALQRNVLCCQDNGWYTQTVYNGTETPFPLWSEEDIRALCPLLWPQAPQR